MERSLPRNGEEERRAEIRSALRGAKRSWKRLAFPFACDRLREFKRELSLGRKIDVFLPREKSRPYARTRPGLGAEQRALTTGSAGASYAAPPGPDPPTRA